MEVYLTKAEPLFDNRYDAGRQLATKLDEYKSPPGTGRIVVLAIPNGGVPVGLEIALALEADFDLIVSRKIPLPLNPEGGFGAVADDGTVILNEEVVRGARLSQPQIDYQVNLVRAEIRRRRLLYRQDRPPALVGGKTVIVTDDGLASGFTMLATVSSLRSRRPKEIIVAVPVSSAIALEQVSKVADRIVTLAIGTMPRFAIADFYRNWHDLSDDEVFRCLDEWRQRRFKANSESPQSNSAK
jgi:putative phosphoribosyl transferase